MVGNKPSPPHPHAPPTGLDAENASSFVCLPLRQLSNANGSPPVFFVASSSVFLFGDSRVGAILDACSFYVLLDNSTLFGGHCPPTFLDVATPRSSRSSSSSGEMKEEEKEGRSPSSTPLCHCVYIPRRVSFPHRLYCRVRCR